MIYAGRINRSPERLFNTRERLPNGKLGPFVVKCPVSRRLGYALSRRAPEEFTPKLSVLADLAHSAETSRALTIRRKYRCTDWVCRVVAPLALEKAAESCERDVSVPLHEYAARLCAIAPICDKNSLKKATEAVATMASALAVAFATSVDRAAANAEFTVRAAHYAARVGVPIWPLAISLLEELCRIRGAP